MRAIDTNVLVRLLVRDDPRQVAAAESFVAGGAWVSHVVLVETSWVLTSVYELEPEAIATAFEGLLEHRDIAVQEESLVAAAVMLFRKRPALGFSDALVLELARRAGCLPLGTFDRELGKVDGAERL